MRGGISESFPRCKSLISIREGSVLMAGGSRTTFTKRQKEKARQERQQEKALKKAQRKQEQPSTSESPTALVISHDEEGQPVGFDFHDFAR